MDGRSDAEMSGLERRQVPMIGGSSAAFIAIVVVLIVVIAVACTAVVYILREEAGAGTEDEEALARRGQRNRYRRSGARDPRCVDTSRNWFKRLLSLPRSNHRADAPRPGKSRTPSEGWMQAGSDESDYDVNTSPSGGGGGVPPNQNHTMMRMAERSDAASGASSPRSSMAGSAPPPRAPIPVRAVRMYSSDSSASSVRFDPHAVRGLVEQTSFSRLGVAPSVQSHVYSSPPSSPSSLSHSHSHSHSHSPAHLQLPSRMTMTSAESIEESESSEQELTIPNHFIHDSSPVHSGPSPSIRTFGSGSRFVEAL